MSAPGTGLRGVSRWNKNNRDTSNIGFISYKQTQLIKCPVIGSASFRFASRLLIETLSNVSQVFKSQCRTHLFRFLNKLLRNVVIQPLLKPLFSPGKPSQEPARIPSAFGLNIAPDLAISVTSGLNLFSTPRFTRGRCGDVSSTQVHPNYFGSFPSRVGGQVNTDIDVVVAVFSFVEGSRCWGLPFEQCQLVVTNTQLELNPTTHQGNANRLQLLNVLKSPHIQINGCRSKLVDLLNSFGITDYTPNCLADMVGFQPSSFPYWLIDLMVKLGCVPAVFAFCNGQYLIASVSKSLQSAVYFRAQLYRDLELAFNRYCLH